MKHEEIIKKISAAVLLSSLAIYILLRSLSKIIPQMTETPTKTEYDLLSTANIFLIILGVSFTVFIFLLLKKKLGSLKAFFYTLYSDSLIGFLIGTVMMSIASMKNISAVGLTAMQSFYYYFLGIMIMAFSASAFLLGLIIFAVLRSIIAIKAKKHQAMR